DLLDSSFHRPVVRLDARLAARHEPGTLSDVALVNPLAEQGDLVLKEGEFDLEFPFPTRRALREELQQDPQAVVAFDPEVSLELVMHRGPELAVEDDRGDPAGVDPGLDLLELPPTDERAAVRMVATLDDRLEDPMARGREERRDLAHVGCEGNQEDVQQASEGHDRHERFQWKPRGGAIRIPLRATDELTLSKVNAMREPCRSVVA